MQASKYYNKIPFENSPPPPLNNYPSGFAHHLKGLHAC